MTPDILCEDINYCTHKREGALSVEIFTFRLHEIFRLSVLADGVPPLPSPPHPYRHLPFLDIWATPPKRPTGGLRVRLAKPSCITASQVRPGPTAGEEWPERKRENKPTHNYALYVGRGLRGIKFKTPSRQYTIAA